MARWFVWITSVVAAIGTLIAMPGNAEAWHGCHPHSHGASPIWGSYGMGGGFRHAGWGGYCGMSFSTGYSPFQSCYTTSFRSYSPRCLSHVPSFYSSFYGCNPGYSTSYYCPPIYPTYCFPHVYSSYYCPPVAYRPVVLPTIVFPRPRIAPVIFQATRIPICVSKPIVASRAVSSLAIASPRASWLTSAVELIDLMVEQGGIEEGLQACEQLIRVRDGLPSEIYWRAAALAAISGRESSVIVALIDDAEEAGDRFSARQFPGGSLRAYLRTANVATLDGTLNRLAKAALTSEDPTSDYRVLSAMFALDSQPDRARLFLAAAAKAAPETGTASLASLATLER